MCSLIGELSTYLPAQRIMPKRGYGDFENPPARPPEQRVEEFRQEVKALNQQFASWVARNNREYVV